jgi:hypothetical protein
MVPRKPSIGSTQLLDLIDKSPEIITELEGEQQKLERKLAILSELRNDLDLEVITGRDPYEDEICERQRELVVKLDAFRKLGLKKSLYDFSGKRGSLKR